jgi:hypothetical protein
MSEVKYEVGKWYGWNNEGDCPVHPESVVDVIFKQGGRQPSSFRFKAKAIRWKDDKTPIVSFHIIKEYKEPETIWVNYYEGGARYVHSTEEGAIKTRTTSHGEFIEYCITKKFVEVI